MGVNHRGADIPVTPKLLNGLDVVEPSSRHPLWGLLVSLGGYDVMFTAAAWLFWEGLCWRYSDAETPLLLQTDAQSLILTDVTDVIVTSLFRVTVKRAVNGNLTPRTKIHL